MFTQLPPLTLYIHFPWCVQKCPYCDFNSHQTRGDIPQASYIDQLIDDFQRDVAWLQGRTIDAIFCGGGTPSLFSADELARLFTSIRQQANIAKTCEITLEANPGTIDQHHFAGYRELGINRLSLGVQSWDDTQLQRLGRIHQSQQCETAIDILKSVGFTNFNVDIMYGLPSQTRAAALHDLRLACETGATHVSWYQLTLEPNTVFHQKPPKNLPVDDVLWDIEQRGYQLLAEHNFLRYEVSAYAKSHRQCQHNLNYWQFGDYLGIGAGAHGKITDQKTQKIIRTLKHKHPKKYLSVENDFYQQKNIVATIELPFEFMLNALRLFQPITFNRYEQYTGLDRAELMPVLQQLVQDDLVKFNDSQFELTSLGQHFLNDVVTAFLTVVNSETHHVADS